MADIVFDAALFRAQLPAFTDPVKYPDLLLQAYWDHAALIADTTDCGVLFNGARALALNLLAAHLLTLAPGTAKNKQGGFVNSATVDKVTVQKVAPPASDMFEWWLGQTPYGQELLMLLEVCSVGGISVGGLPESRGFRKWSGIF